MRDREQLRAFLQKKKKKLIMFDLHSEEKSLLEL